MLKVFPKKVIEKAKPKHEEKPAVVEVATEGPTCACGKPVAPGQSAVCKDHIRAE